jgi:hypothetical protein
MSTITVARRLVELCRQGKFGQAQEELYAREARSLEPDAHASGPLGNVEGYAAIREKARLFDETCKQLHGVTVSDPQIAGNFFSLTMGLDATFKEGGRRSIEEVCVYEVANDKIVREQFFY